MRRAHFTLVFLVLVAVLFLSHRPIPAQTDEAAAEPSDPNAARLEAIGGLSAINAQHTYLLIGVVSDAHIKGIYEPKQVRSMMNSVIRQLETLNGMLHKLLKGDLSDDDAVYVKRVVAVHLKLQSQAKALNSFVETKGDSEARVFEKSRQATLRELERLLGTDEVPVEEPAGTAGDTVEKPVSK